MSAAQSGLYSGRYFDSAEQAAIQFQYEARLCSANSRELNRYGPMQCAAMQRRSSELYAAARAATEWSQVKRLEGERAVWPAGLTHLPGVEA